MGKVAKDIMNKKVVTIKKDETIEKLTKLLIKNDVSGLPVIDDDNNIVGVVTEADIIMRESDLPFPISFSFSFLQNYESYTKSTKEYLQTKVENIMTKKTKTVLEDTPVHKITNIMINNNINRLPVVNAKNKLVGIIARSDILKAMIENK